MPEKTTHNLFSHALAELEQIVEQLELDNDEKDAESNITQLESGSDLTGFKNLKGLTIIIPPKK